MKKVSVLSTIVLFFSLIFTVASVNAYTSPGKPQGFVNDYANILSDGVRVQLESQLSEFSKATTIQVAVVTIPALTDETIETYAVKLFEEWGIGDKEKDNGVLFLIAPTDRKVRIEVGYGLEGVLTDAQSNGIIQKIVLPEFRAGNMEKGITDGTNAIVSVVKSEADYSAVESSNGKSYGQFFEFAIFIFFMLISVLASTKSWWLGGVLGGIAGIVIGVFQGVFVGVVATIILIIVGLIVDYIVSKHGGKGGGFWPIFIGGGRGGSSGGFGGFGGGGSGGGGSSGSW